MKRTVTFLSAACLAAATVAVAGPPPESTRASELAAGVQEHFAALNDYEYTMESEVRGGKEAKKGTYQIWCRKPELFRLKVLRGRHSGSELAVTPSGKIRARPGGILGKVVVKEFSKTDSRLRGPRGGYAWESDPVTQARRLQERLAVAQTVKIEPVTNSPSQFRIDFVYRSPETGEITREVWTLDSARDHLLEKEIYEKGEQVEVVHYRDYREAPGLQDSFFKL